MTNRVDLCVWCGRRPGCCPDWCPTIDEVLYAALTGTTRPQHLHLVT